MFKMLLLKHAKIHFSRVHVRNTYKKKQNFWKRMCMNVRIKQMQQLSFQRNQEGGPSDGRSLLSP